MNAVRPDISADLIARYGGPGPRYTSYPTAVEFSSQFSGADWLAAVKASNHELIPADLSVYVHVPFCSSPCFYCGCNRVITRSKTVGDEFLRYLEAELEIVTRLVATDRKVQQVHFGGGTPTFLGLEQIRRLLKMISEHLEISPRPEIGLEIDPRTVDGGSIIELAEMGFNRLSLGVQDLDPKVQQAVNREHDETVVAGLMDAARSAGYESVSMDLIYGLPHQTGDSFAHTMERIIAMRPERLSLFNYAHMPHKFKAQRRIKAADLPDPDTRLEIFYRSMDRLLAAGYEFIGMDHFALPEDPLTRARDDGSMVRNFQGYSTHGGLDLLAFGPSAISQAGDALSQNLHQYRDWRDALDAGKLPVIRGLLRSAEDCLRAEVINAIMCRGKLLYKPIEARFEIDFRTHFKAELEQLETLQDDGLIRRHREGFDITPTGQMLLRAIARVFDAYLQPAEPPGEPSSPRFSRIV